MRHNREEVIACTIQEYKLLDELVSDLSDAQWEKPVPRPATKDPWTVKDALAYITIGRRMWPDRPEGNAARPRSAAWEKPRATALSTCAGVTARRKWYWPGIGRSNKRFWKHSELRQRPGSAVVSTSPNGRLTWTVIPRTTRSGISSAPWMAKISRGRLCNMKHDV
jgi:hypothetical protein